MSKQLYKHQFCIYCYIIYPVFSVGYNFDIGKKYFSAMSFFFVPTLERGNEGAGPGNDRNLDK